MNRWLLAVAVCVVAAGLGCGGNGGSGDAGTVLPLDDGGTGCPGTPPLGEVVACQGSFTCNWGSEYCCGKAHPSISCYCRDGFLDCVHTDACLFPACEYSDAGTNQGDGGDTDGGQLVDGGRTDGGANDGGDPFDGGNPDGGASDGGLLDGGSSDAGASNRAQVSAGGGHTCATRVDGTLWCWGWNLKGQLGNGSGGDSLFPTQVDGGSAQWEQVAAGHYAHTCATRTNGTLWCWGFNAYGQLGDGTWVDKYSPVQVAGGVASWAQVSAGAWHTCATGTNRTLWCWGANLFGQVGDGTDAGYRVAPVQVAGSATNWSQLSGGDYHTCATRMDGSLWCWGDNYDGQLGDGTDAGYRLTPVQVDGGAANWAQVSAGAYHTCATGTDGALWCWGDNQYGQLGDGTLVDKYCPVQLDGGATHWARVSAGQYHTCATGTDGTIWCWGRNNYGQLGDGTDTGRLTPGVVGGGATNWAQVSAGAWHTCATRTDDTVWCWGNGELGNGTDAGSAIPVQVK